MRPQKPALVPWDMDKSLRTWLLAVGIIVSDDAGGWRLADSTFDIKARAFARKVKIANNREKVGYDDMS